MSQPRMWPSASGPPWMKAFSCCAQWASLLDWPTLSPLPRLCSPCMVCSSTCQQLPPQVAAQLVACGSNSQLWWSGDVCHLCDVSDSVPEQAWPYQRFMLPLLPMHLDIIDWPLGPWRRWLEGPPRSYWSHTTKRFVALASRTSGLRNNLAEANLPPAKSSPWLFHLPFWVRD